MKCNLMIFPLLYEFIFSPELIIALLFISLVFLPKVYRDSWNPWADVFHLFWKILAIISLHIASAPFLFSFLISNY